MTLSQQLAESIEAYLVYLEGSRGYARHTRAQYQRQLYSIGAALERQGLTSWAALSARAVESLLLSWRRQGVGVPSIHQRLAALRSFADYLCEQGHLQSNPAKLIKAPKAKRRLPKNMDVDGVASLLDKEPSSELEIRDRTMFELIYSAGLRVSELVSLNVDDLPGGRHPERELRVTGKGSKTRIVPYGREAQRWIEQWLEARQTWPQKDSAALFIGQRGTRLSVRSVQLRLKQWGLEQGSPENLHPHKLRHSFASHMLESSGDLRAVQELLGHANLSTTQVYTHLDFQHLAGVYDKAHPRAKKKP